MEFEPAYQPDGSVSGWLAYRGAAYLGSVCRTKPRRWQVNDCGGAVVGVFRTRREAFDYLHALRHQPVTDVQTL
jgi:hypothetical protein